MHSDHAKLVYLRRLIENVTLDAGEVRRTGEVVARLRAGYQVAEVVLAIASRYALADSATREVFLRAALALDSGNEQARAVLAIMAGATLSKEELAAVLRVAARMRVDHDKSRVLLGVAGTQRLDADLRNAYLMAAETIRDARVRERTLNGLVSR